MFQWSWLSPISRLSISISRNLIQNCFSFWFFSKAHTQILYFLTWHHASTHLTNIGSKSRQLCKDGRDKLTFAAGYERWRCNSLFCFVFFVFSPVFLVYFTNKKKKRFFRIFCRIKKKIWIIDMGLKQIKKNTRVYLKLGGITFYY